MQPKNEKNMKMLLIRNNKMFSTMNSAKFQTIKTTANRMLQASFLEYLIAAAAALFLTDDAQHRHPSIQILTDDALY